MAKYCETMQDVRTEIDRVDREIVKILAERVNYIEQAARIKPLRGQVRDQDRVNDVITKVTAEAEKNGAPTELVTLLYEQMVEWCINYEFKVFDQIEEQSK